MGLHINDKERPTTNQIKREMPRSLLVVRLVIASVIFAVSSTVSMPAIIKVILLALAALVAAYDVILEAINSVESGDYFAAPIVIVFVAVIAFVIGYAIDATAMVILYKTVRSSLRKSFCVTATRTKLLVPSIRPASPERVSLNAATGSAPRRPSF